jgi:hypothetical protein
MQAPMIDCVGVCLNVAQMKDKNYRNTIVNIELKQQKPPQ